ncbi:type III restriction protein, res subunit [Secundilactobacillus pentosiphilus]|uniref:Type III restriction protein, res subunit n=1 Tax=Secundilactobacillus pentosiphilus TaxID=1714682 RepID=A0A1Z5ITC7_9LACO|nr:DEAD/DEAH box helicase [Secundilactobacillus pentosiphilus]GAX05023.1 type III restriction protein, res subunit [Secundilactobacillus pentosiphilus]
MTKIKTFELNGQRYEIVAKANDQSMASLGEIVIYREVNTEQLFTMPLSELKNHLIEQQINWTARLDLFKRRFVGRTDVYASRYFNKKAQRKAYSPAGPWENGRPSETVHYPLTDDVIRKHLSRHDSSAIGLYPLTKENTTPFLAIDIDGHHENQPWKQLAQSITKVCTKYDISHLIELSQSGVGCHIWLFFDRPISATKARHFGDAILQATQAIEPRLPFSAFDRMFPSQDRIDGKQLGNLIAAPLEGQAILQGRNCFVDASWHPLKRQWKVLKQIGILTEKDVTELTEKITSRTGYRLFEDDRPAESNLFDESFSINRKLTVKRANLLYIKKTDLSSKELLQLKYLSSFRNPEFYKAQASRRSVYNIPRIISLFHETNDVLALPRGLEDKLKAVVASIDWVDDTIAGHPLHVNFNGKLYDNQLPAYSALMDSYIGILAARTGFGKTVISARIIAERAVSTLILVKNKTLAEQWYERLSSFLDIKDEPVIEEYTPKGRKKHKNKIGTYYGVKKNPSGLVDIATIQSISKMEDSQAFLDHYGMVISDEVHHDAAYTFDSVIEKIRGKYLYGLSATPYRRDGQEPIIIMRFGPIRYQTDIIDPEYALSVSRSVVPRFTNLGMTSLEMLNNGRNENNLAILNDSERNANIIRDCKRSLDEGKHVIVLTNLISHVDQLYAQLPPEKTFRIYGGINARDRKKQIEKINQFKDAFIVLATVSIGGEGLDIPSLDTIILAMPISFRGNVEQVVGRLNRNLAHKKELRIYDYVDMFVPMLMHMYRKRCSSYRRLGYEIVEDDYSKQRGLKMYSGHYQNSILSRDQKATEVFITTPKLKPFLHQLINQVINHGGKIHILTKEAPDPELVRHVNWTQYEHNLPNCIIIDAQQLWLCSDPGFGFNKGMAIRMEHAEFTKSFEEMLIQTITRLN